MDKVWVVVAQDYDYVPGVRVFDNKAEAERFAAASNHPGRNVFCVNVENGFPETYYTTYQVTWKPFVASGGYRPEHLFKVWVANHMVKTGCVPCPENGILESRYEEKINETRWQRTDHSEVRVTSTISLNHATEVAVRLVKEKTGKDVTPPEGILPKETKSNAS